MCNRIRSRIDVTFPKELHGTQAVCRQGQCKMLKRDQTPTPCSQPCAIKDLVFVLWEVEGPADLEMGLSIWHLCRGTLVSLYSCGNTYGLIWKSQTVNLYWTNMKIWLTCISQWKSHNDNPDSDNQVGVANHIQWNARPTLIFLTPSSNHSAI